MNTREMLQYLETLRGVPPTPAQIETLIAALDRSDGIEEFIDETPGWGAWSAPVGRTVVTRVAQEAQGILARSPAVTLLPVARAYSRLSAFARGHARAFFEAVKAEAFGALSPQARVEVLELLAQPPATALDASDADASAQLQARLLSVHRTLQAAERKDDVEAIPRIIEGLTSGSFTRDQETVKLVAHFAPSEPIAVALAGLLLQPEGASSYGLDSALKATGVKLPKALLSQLAEALVRPRSSSHEWVLMMVLGAYGKDPERLDERGRAILVGALARLCLTTPNEGHSSMAIGMVGREDLARELAPLLAERLRRKDEASLIDALRRVAWFGPSMAPLVPRLIELLESNASPRLRYETLKAIQGVGAAAAAAVPALLRLLDTSREDAVVSALGAIGPAAASAVERIQTLRDTAGLKEQRLRVVSETALEKITGKPRS